MMRRIASLFVLLALVPPARAETNAPAAVALDDLAVARQALRDGLWEVARAHAEKVATDEARLVTGIVRDADKLDILRVMEQHLSGTERDATVVLHVADEPDRFSPEVVEAALTGRLASYGQLRYVNDFRILLGTWIYDLSFASSRRMMAEEGYIRRILDGLPDLPPLRRARHALLEKIEADGASGQPARGQVSG